MPDLRRPSFKIFKMHTDLLSLIKLTTTEFSWLRKIPSTTLGYKYNYDELYTLSLKIKMSLSKCLRLSNFWQNVGLFPCSLACLLACLLPRLFARSLAS